MLHLRTTHVVHRGDKDKRQDVLDRKWVFFRKQFSDSEYNFWCPIKICQCFHCFHTENLFSARKHFLTIPKIVFFCFRFDVIVFEVLKLFQLLNE